MAAIPAAAVSTYDPLLDEVAAAEYLGNSHLTLRKWRVIGGGPQFVKIGRLVRYELSALQAFREKGRRTSTSER